MMRETGTKTETKTPSLRYDLILIAGVLIISTLMLLFAYLARSDGGYVEVEQGGSVIATYSLSKSGEYELNGGTNILVIENGAAYLRDANCPDKTCVKTGKIRYVGQSIVCLPNKISVTVRGSADNSVDLVS